MVTEQRLTALEASAALAASIVWIAAYPKSGNTWVRIFLSNLLNGRATPVSINDLPLRLHAASRALFDELAGIASSDLDEREVTNYRPLVYRQLVRILDPPICLKTHDCYDVTPAGDPLFPAEITRAVLYLIRNPLDVAVSYAHHERLSVDRIIERMADEEFAMAGPGRLHLRQHVGGWSSHVRSWLDADLSVQVVRYEDLQTDPFAHFSRIAEQAGVASTPARIRQGIEFSSFDRLRDEERRTGFAETPVGGSAFFRKGRSGDWRAALTSAQIDRIVRDHGVIMNRFGYLSPAGTPA